MFNKKKFNKSLHILGAFIFLYYLSDFILEPIISYENTTFEMYQNPAPTPFDKMLDGMNQPNKDDYWIGPIFTQRF